MLKKNYRLILLNEKTRFNQSFSINKSGLFFLYFILLSITFFMSFGVFRIFKPHSTQQEFNILKNNQNDMLYVLKNITNIDSTILENEKINNLYVKNIKMVPDNMPVKGIVTRGLVNSKQNPHNGLDIAAKLNSQIYAAQEGLIIFANNLHDLGNTIIISHPNNYFTLYSHLDKIDVSPRQYIKVNQKIGTIGESGNSDGPHLHFEIWQNSNIIDPRSIIKEYKINDVSIQEDK